MKTVLSTNLTRIHSRGQLSLKRVLFAQTFDSSLLNPANQVHLALIRGRALEDALFGHEMAKDEIIARYEARLAPLIIGRYEMVRHGEALRLNDFWEGAKGGVHLKILVKYLFEQVLGLRIDERTRTIDQRLFGPNQKAFLGSQGVTDWPALFAQYKLKGMMIRALEQPNSVVEAVRRTYPWMFDSHTAEGQHLHLLDFPRLPKVSGPDEARCAELRHVLEKHLGLEMDEATGSIDQRYLGTNQRAYLASQGVARWLDLLVKIEAAGLVRGVFKDSFYLALKTAYPWAFDLSTPEGRHLHPWDFSPQGIWLNRETRIVALKHLFERHLVLVVEPKKISQEITTARGIKTVLQREGVNGWNELFEKHGLVCLLYSYEVKNTTEVQAIAALREAYPFAFDQNSPEGAHLHPWLFRANWGREAGRGEAVTAVRHIFSRHLGIINDETRTISSQLKEGAVPAVGGWHSVLADEGLAGLYGVVYRGRPKELLADAYPWLFDLKTEEGQHLHPWRLPSGKKMSDEQADEIVKTSLRHIAVQHLGLALDRDSLWKGLRKKVLFAHGLSKKMFRVKYGCSRAALLRVAFPELFPKNIPLQDWLGSFRAEPCQWGEVPINVQKWFVTILAAELNKDPGMLMVGDFQACLPVFAGKNLMGLLRHYRTEGMTDPQTLVLIKKRFQLTGEERDIGYWLSQLRAGNINWKIVPPSVKIKFILLAAWHAEKHFLRLSAVDYRSPRQLFGGKTLSGLLSLYLKTGEKPELALIRLVRLVMQTKREEALALKDDEMVRRKYADKGAKLLISLEPEARNRYINAYLDPQLFELEERKKIAFKLLTACREGIHPIATVGGKYRADISDGLVMLGYIADLGVSLNQ